MACNFSSLIWPASSAPAALASLLFDPPEPQIIGKNTVFRDFPTFSRICIFFLLTLSLLSASALLCFSSVHIAKKEHVTTPSYTIVSFLGSSVYQVVPSTRRGGSFERKILYHSIGRRWHIGKFLRCRSNEVLKL